MSVDVYMSRMRGLNIPENQIRYIALIKNWKDKLIRIGDSVDVISVMERKLIEESILETILKIDSNYIIYIDKDVFTSNVKSLNHM